MFHKGSICRTKHRNQTSPRRQQQAQNPQPVSTRQAEREMQAAHCYPSCDRAHSGACAAVYFNSSGQDFVARCWGLPPRIGGGAAGVREAEIDKQKAEIASEMAALQNGKDPGRPREGTNKRRLTWRAGRKRHGAGAGGKGTARRRRSLRRWIRKARRRQCRMRSVIDGQDTDEYAQRTVLHWDGQDEQPPGKRLFYQQ